MSGFYVYTGNQSYDIVNQILPAFTNTNSDLANVMDGTTNITQADYTSKFSGIDTYNDAAVSMNANGFDGMYMDGNTDIMNNSLARFKVHTNTTQEGHSIGGANKMIILLLGGGGGGGAGRKSNNSNYNGCGGGGGGGILAHEVVVNNSNANYNIYVGGGGAGATEGPNAAGSGGDTVLEMEAVEAEGTYHWTFRGFGGGGGGNSGHGNGGAGGGKGKIRFGLANYVAVNGVNGGAGTTGTISTNGNGQGGPGGARGTANNFYDFTCTPGSWGANNKAGENANGRGGGGGGAGGSNKSGGRSAADKKGGDGSAGAAVVFFRYD